MNLDLPGRRAPTASSETIPAFFQRIVIGLAAIVLTACGCVGGICWRISREMRERDTEFRASLARFESRFVEHLESIVENSRDTTCTDLTAVRFRIRFEDRFTWPTEKIAGELSAVWDPAQIQIRHTNRFGVLDFGLVPPGQYRLALTREDGFAIDQTFEVTAGVSIDRVLTCPGIALTPGLVTSFNIQSTADIQSQGWALVGLVEQDDIKLGDWNWKAALPRRAWVLAGGVDSDRQRLAAQLDSMQLFDSKVSCHFRFRYARLIQLAVCRVDESGQSAPQHFTTIRFDQTGEALQGGMLPGASTYGQPWELRHIWNGKSLSAEWLLDLPREIRLEIDRAIQSAGPSQNVVELIRAPILFSH